MNKNIAALAKIGEDEMNDRMASVVKAYIEGLNTAITTNENIYDYCHGEGLGHVLWHREKLVAIGLDTSLYDKQMAEVLEQVNCRDEFESLIKAKASTEQNVQGLTQYADVIRQIFGKFDIPHNRKRDIFFVDNLDTLRQTPLSELFYGERPHANNIPRAIAITGHNRREDKYFFPVMVVDYVCFEEPNRTSFIRSNVVRGFGWDRLIQIVSGVGEGYQVVMKTRGLEKSGISKDDKSNLESWVEKTITISRIFQSPKLSELERKYFDDGITLGNGFC